MIRQIDSAGRIFISMKWLAHCTESIAIIKTADKGQGLILEPFDPQKHDLENVLFRKVDDHARIKIPPDLFRVVGLSAQNQYDLYIAPDNTAYLRKMGNYCDVCGRETKTRTVLGRELCEDCFNLLKQSE